MRMDSGVSLHNSSSRGWSGECVDLDCHHSGSRGVMQSSLNRHSCVCWSITWVRLKGFDVLWVCLGLLQEYKDQQEV
jgi:hypothetical protein